MKNKNQQTITLSLPVILAVLLLTAAIILLATRVFPYGRQRQIPPVAKTAPSPPPLRVVQDNPYVKLLDKLENREPLTEHDQQVRQQILTLLNEEENGTYKTYLYAIDYVNSTDHFQVEVLTSNINNAKSEAYSWFIAQGMSHQGICNLPVQFYLSSEVKEYLQRPNIEVNPLPPGC